MRLGGESNFHGGIALQPEVLAQGLADDGSRVKDQDAVVRGAQAEFVFGADHAF